MLCLEPVGRDMVSRRKGRGELLSVRMVCLPVGSLGPGSAMAVPVLLSFAEFD